MDVYAEDCGKVAHDVREWCKSVDDDRRLRIALCGYDVEHAELEARGWDVLEWSTNGGMAKISKGDTAGKANRLRERIWFSPTCRRDPLLWGDA